MIEFLLLIIFGVVTYMVAGEGAWGSAITCVSVIVAGLIAMNFFEPICQGLLGTNAYWQARLDLIVLVGLFAAAVGLLRAGADYLSPTYIAVHRMVHEAGRWGCGLLTGYVTMAFLLTALHTAPLGREFMGFKPERPNFFGMSPDRQWLGFTQWTTERVFSKSPARIFDGPVIVFSDRTAVPNDVWPSFPIRYATRRERGAGAAAGAVQAPIRPVAPPKAGGPAF
jgi:hypothetical protein